VRAQIAEQPPGLAFRIFSAVTNKDSSHKVALNSLFSSADSGRLTNDDMVFVFLRCIIFKSTNL
jgi:hypothetical protein